jgi:hypothetical protein
VIVGITELTNDKNDRERKYKKGDYRTTSGNQNVSEIVHSNPSGIVELRPRTNRCGTTGNESAIPRQCANAPDRTASGNQEIIGLQNDRISDCR